MPILDVSEQNNSLDNDYGATHGSNAPDEHELILFDGDPAIDGTELDPGDAPGYVATVVSNDGDWPAAADGQKTRVVELASPTDPWTVVATHWGLRNPDTGGVGDTNRLSPPLKINEGGGTPTIVVVIHYGADIE